VLHGALAIAALVLPRHSRPALVEPAATAIELVPAPGAASPRVVASAQASFGGAPAGPRGAPAPRHARSVAPRGPAPTRALDTTVRFEAPGADAAADGTGTSGGRGGAGGGDGLGLGTGVARVEEVAHLALPMPPPARRSLARPPILVYPKRTVPTSGDEDFVARLRVDADGIVVGSQLLKGMNLPVVGAVWRFRYSPALDDDGHPIAAVIDQPFVVE